MWTETRRLSHVFFSSGYMYWPLTTQSMNQTAPIRSADSVTEFIIKIYSTAGKQMAVSEIRGQDQLLSQYASSIIVNFAFQSFSIPYQMSQNSISFQLNIFFHSIGEISFLNCCQVNRVLTLNATLDFGPNRYRLHQFLNEIISFSKTKLSNVNWWTLDII